MSASALSGAIRHVITWFTSERINYCLVGGLAVSFRTIERATRDIDFAIGVPSDEIAENLIRSLQQIGFAPVELLQRRDSGAISTVRLLSPEFPGIFLDLLFSACGIENEVVATATNIEILPGLTVPAATTPSLIAMKVLSSGHKGRRQDLLDLEHLIRDATPEELREAKELTALIVRRRMNDGRDLPKLLDELVAEITS
jgi:hypothetical protein